MLPPWSFLHKKKSNSSNIISLIEGETPATHTLHNGAFMTKVKFEKKNQQAIGYEWTQNASFVSIFQKKKIREEPPPLPHATGKDKNYTQFWGKKSTDNRQKWAKNALFASVFQKFPRGDPKPPPYGNDKTIPLFGFIDPRQLRGLLKKFCYALNIT